MSLMVLLGLDVDASLASSASIDGIQADPIISTSDSTSTVARTESILFLDSALISSNSLPLTCSENPAANPSNPRQPIGTGSVQYWDHTRGHSEMARPALAAMPAIGEGCQYWDPARGSN